MKIATGLLAPAVPVLTLHRFVERESGLAGLEIETFRRLLRSLTVAGYGIIGLREILNCLSAGRQLPRRAICLTVDDGYEDFYRLALPALLELDATATVFTVTDFVSGRNWLWWDKVEHIIMSRESGVIRHEGSESRQWQWDGLSDKSQFVRELVDEMKGWDDDVRRGAVAAFGRQVNVPLDAVPSRYAPMSWEQVRECDRVGMTFGAHSASHPILSRTSDRCSREEIDASWSELKRELPTALPVFCYPNGSAADFGRREEIAVAAAGLTSAFSTIPGYLSQKSFNRTPFALPRYACVPDLDDLLQIVSGLERVKQRVRGLFIGLDA